MAAYAQSTRDLTNRLNRLENEVDTLNRAVYKGETPPPPSISAGDAQNSAGQEVRIQQLEAELRNLTGQIEEQNFKIRQMEELLEKVTSDLSMRMQDLENGGVRSSQQGAMGNDGYQWQSGSSSVEVNPDIVGSGAVTGGQASDPPAALYEAAYAKLKINSYDEAEKGFQDFINRYPAHALAGNAKYWLGESYYVRGQYESAARVFAEAYQQYPQNSKAADNLLKLAMSLAGLKKNGDACVALEQLKKEYSSSAAPVVQRGEQEMSRLGCN